MSDIDSDEEEPFVQIKRPKSPPKDRVADETTKTVTKETSTTELKFEAKLEKSNGKEKKEVKQTSKVSVKVEADSMVVEKTKGKSAKSEKKTTTKAVKEEPVEEEPDVNKSTDDDEEEEEQVSKSPKKKVVPKRKVNKKEDKTPKKKETAKKTNKKEIPKKPVAPKKEESENESEDELIDDDEDFDDDDDFVKEEKKPAKRKSRSSVKDEVDEDDDFIEKAPSKSKKAIPKKSPRKPAPKATVKPTPKATVRATPKKAVKRGRESDDEDEKPLKKKVKTRSKSPSKETTEERKARKAKERLEAELPDNKWWENDGDEETDPSIKWTTLEHNGVLFPPEYKPLPSHVKLIYDGKPIDLNSESEEIATFYALHSQSDHVKKEVFRKNFFSDWKKILNASMPGKKEHPIKSLEKCDFSAIYDYLMEEREKRKNRTKEDKLEEKRLKEEELEKFGYALVDNRREKIANYKIEPPGLFLGRGAHPKAGRLKRRVLPQHVTINIGHGIPPPPCPIEGKWHDVVHNNQVTWLAMWKENVNDQHKYVWLSASSAIKGRADRSKFEIARQLKKYIKSIRDTYIHEMKSSDPVEQQRATALYFIDRLALRVGNEKGEDEADTVGCCSLRVEHLELLDNNRVTFDFLGKDSMRYQNTVEVAELVYKNLKKFMKGKKQDADLFDQLTTSNLNQYLKSQMEGLTAKVFRTYNASITLQQELDKMPDNIESVDEKLLFFNRANRQVAILCNHQRTLPKTHSSQMEKLDEKIKELRDQQDELRARLKQAKRGTLKKESETDSPKKRMPTDPDKIENQIKSLDQRIQKWEIKKIEKEENKSFSTTTSKVNYLDPRITVAWCKKNNVDISKIFSKSLRQKFPWALDVSENFKF